MKRFLRAVGGLIVVSVAVLVLAGVMLAGVRGGATIAWLPQGVRVIEVVGVGIADGRANVAPISRRVTGPSQVRRIVAWFNRLDEQQLSSPCGSDGKNATITFQSANGIELAAAWIPAVAPNGCSSIYFERGQLMHESPLINLDRPSGFIERVQRLLRVRFVGVVPG